jgi:hypothetical protein
MVLRDFNVAHHIDLRLCYVEILRKKTKSNITKFKQTCAKQSYEFLALNVFVWRKRDGGIKNVFMNSKVYVT